ncbi:unnamed protein product [Rotaria sp. Silwood1]|nr:unnamed protein product [Rotaria sp. Silwood1]CAF1611627.1 unnamed protein product [Rotaria sp. Silwood1]
MQHFTKMEDRLSQLTEELKKIRQENEFNEINIVRIKTQLTKLGEELVQLPNVTIKKENTSFIEKFSVVVSSETRQEKKSNKTDLNKNQTKLTEDSNPIDSALLINISSIHLSSEHGTSSKTDQKRQESSDVRDQSDRIDNEHNVTLSSNVESYGIELLSSNNENDVKSKTTEDNDSDGSITSITVLNSTICTDINTSDRMPLGSQVVRRKRVSSAAHHTRGKSNNCTTDTVLSPNDCKPSMFDKSFNRKDQHESNCYNEKTSFSRSKGDVASQISNVNDSDESRTSTTFHNSSIRAGFTIGGRMHRGPYRGQSRSGVHDNRGGSRGRSSNRCFKCNKPGHFCRECPEERKPRNSDGDGIRNSNVRRNNNRVSDDIFNQPDDHPMEHYISSPAPTTEDDIFIEAIKMDEDFEKYSIIQIRSTPLDKVKPIKLNEEANLDIQVLSNIRLAHFEDLTAIQRYILPCIRQRDDLLVCVQIESNKSAPFILPIISNLLECHADELSNREYPPSPLCLIVSPTCELALKTEREARKITDRTAVVPCSVADGHDMFTASDRLQEGCHILSATIGHLKDIVKKGQISLKKVKYLVIDEADQMLDADLESDIRKLESLGLSSKEERITWIFSATFSNELQQLAKYFLREDYIFFYDSTNADVAHTIEEVLLTKKQDRLFQLLEQNLKSGCCLIFVETQQSADDVGALLSQKDFMSIIIHDNQTHQQRNEALEQFTNGKCRILIATFVAAHDLYFPFIDFAINYDLPDTSDFYNQRHAGHWGKSISFFDPDRESDRKIALEVILKLCQAGQAIPEFLIKYVDVGTIGFYHDDHNSTNSNVHVENNDLDRQHQTSGPIGSTASTNAATED